MKAPKLENLGSLITYKDEDGNDRCLGDLMDFAGRGVYDATFGKVDVSPEDARKHNDALTQALLEGLDTNCQIGQGGTFYLGVTDGRAAVKTFTGITVTTDVTVKGSTITFRRHGKVYRGRKQKDAECFDFRRVS